MLRPLSLLLMNCRSARTTSHSSLPGWKGAHYVYRRLVALFLSSQKSFDAQIRLPIVYNITGKDGLLTYRSFLPIGQRIRKRRQLTPSGGERRIRTGSRKTRWRRRPQFKWTRQYLVVRSDDFQKWQVCSNRFLFAFSFFFHRPSSLHTTNFDNII